MPPLLLETPRSLESWIGRDIPSTDWFTLTQDRIERFAEATEDRQWIHLDAERARAESPFGAPVAHGFLTLSLLSYFLKQAVEIKGGFRLSVNYGLNRVRFPAPVRSGAKIRGRVTVLAVDHLPDCAQAVLSILVEAESESKPCCVAEWVIRYYG